MYIRVKYIILQHSIQNKTRKNRYNCQKKTCGFQKHVPNSQHYLCEKWHSRCTKNELNRIQIHIIRNPRMCKNTMFTVFDVPVIMNNAFGTFEMAEECVVIFFFDSFIDE